MNKCVLILAALVLAGCATAHKWDRATMTRFEMTGADTWRMTATTAANYPPESEKAEAIRLGWIDQHAQANDCAAPEVTERRWTAMPTDSFSRTGTSKSVGTLIYEGRCAR